MKIDKKKVAVVFFFLLGIIMLVVSQIITQKIIESATENGVNYVVEGPIVQGDNLTRHYSIGEIVSLVLVTKARQAAEPDLIPLNFTLTGPGSIQSVFVIWLEPFDNPDSDFPDLAVTEVDVLAVKGMNVNNSSRTKFVGEIIQDGDYTLLFTSTIYTESNSPLTYLALSKLVTETEQPYFFLAPLGIALVVVGLCLAVWVIRSPRKRHSLRQET